MYIPSPEHLLSPSPDLLDPAEALLTRGTEQPQNVMYALAPDASIA